MRTKPKVLVTRKIPQAAVDLLSEHCAVDYNRLDKALSPTELTACLTDCDGVVCLLLDKINDHVLVHASKLKVVSNVAVGYDNLDIPALTRRGIMATNTPGVLTDTTADFAFALLMAAARRVAEADKYVRDGKFKEWGVELLLGRDIHHATLGILGLGRIGLGMARRARGFDMRVIYSSRTRATPEVEKEYGLEYADKDTVIRESDFLSLHVPLTPSTRHFISARELGMMKKSAILVNTTRGPVVDEAALVEALQNNVIAAAGLDVFEQEPKVHPGLMALRNVVMAPHIASASIATRTRMATMAVENCIAAVTGKVPPNLINPDVVPSK